MVYTRLYADEAGETHMEDVEVGFSTVDFAPPAPPVDISDLVETERCAFLRTEAGWTGDWHPAPARQFLVVLAGDWEVETSDAEKRRFSAGAVVLAEDLEGKGHVTRVSPEGPGLAAVIQL